MNDEDREKLLDVGFSGESPREVFRARVLLNSTAAFHKARGRHAWRRFALLGAAAVLIAGVSFLLGRCSVPPGEPRPMPKSVQATATVAVRDEVVAWLEAAQLFRQLGMEDRMARAVDRASQLLPGDAATGAGAMGQVFAAVTEGKKPLESMGAPDAHLRAENTSRILAHSFGD